MKRILLCGALLIGCQYNGGTSSQIVKPSACPDTAICETTFVPILIFPAAIRQCHCPGAPGYETPDLSISKILLGPDHVEDPAAQKVMTAILKGITEARKTLTDKEIAKNLMDFKAQSVSAKVAHIWENWSEEDAPKPSFASILAALQALGLN